MPVLHVSTDLRKLCIFTPELIVNDIDIGLPICHPAGDVPISIDASGQHACASVDAKDVFVDCYRRIHHQSTTATTIATTTTTVCHCNAKQRSMT
jgi:hypothetical protein